MTETEKNIVLSFRYEEKSGKLWRIRRRSWDGFRKVKEPAGTDSHGYRVTTFKGKHYPNHRLAWFLKTGSFPEKYLDVDHINGDKKDNRWCNLRLAKRGQNNMNSGNPKNNTTGQKGVHRTREKWFARIKVDQKIIHLGCFEKYGDAVTARKKAEEKYFGEFMKGSVL